MSLTQGWSAPTFKMELIGLGPEEKYELDPVLRRRSILSGKHKFSDRCTKIITRIFNAVPSKKEFQDLVAQVAKNGNYFCDEGSLSVFVKRLDRMPETTDNPRLKEGNTAI